MSHVNFMGPGLKLARDGIDMDEKGHHQEAYKLYESSVQNLMLAIKHNPKNKSQNDMLKSKCSNIVCRMEDIKKSINQDAKSTKQSNNQPQAENQKDSLKSQLEKSIVSEKPNVQWSDIAGLDNVKTILKRSVILPVRRPELFQKPREPWRGVLLYGPPGTGKTHIAKAVATESDSTLFSVSSSNLVSKWQGESARLIKTLFNMAREQKPSIIFIDEVDAICCKRTDSDSGAKRQILTEFLKQMEGLGCDNDGIMVLAATNTPWDIDEAMRRRFQKRIYIPLPDQETRSQLLRIKLKGVGCRITREQGMSIVKSTEGFSGSDINNMFKQANMNPVSRCEKATHYKKIQINDQELHTPCNSNDPGALPMCMDDVPTKIHPPTLTYDDLMDSLKSSTSSVEASQIERFDLFTEQFGESG
jgi:vacuolar protein-sorting-associated protein 4